MVADLDLHRDVRQVLAEMSTVSDAPAARLDGDRVSHGKTAGGRPIGTSESMFDRWATRFAAETDDDRLRVLLHLARRELLTVRKRRPVPVSVDPDTGRVQIVKVRDRITGRVEHVPLREDEQQRNERILDWYDGLDALEAALLESTLGGHCSASAIRRLRRQNDRHPQTGRPVEPSDRRRALARRLDAAGYSERRIATELGVARSTVRRLLGRLGDGKKAA